MPTLLFLAEVGDKLGVDTVGCVVFVVFSLACGYWAALAPRFACWLPLLPAIACAGLGEADRELAELAAAEGLSATTWPLLAPLAATICVLTWRALRRAG